MQEAPLPTVTEPPVPMADMTVNVMPVQEVKVETKTEAKTETKTEVKTEVKADTAETKSETKETPKAVDVPKGKDLVPGFGVVMSLDIINAPIAFQQQQLDIALDYSQELPDGIRGHQEFITELISEGSATGIFDIGSKRWRDLYRNYEVQPGY
jgi:hypothetical protein